LNQKQALLLILLLSLGLWAVLWGLFLAIRYVLALIS